MARADAAQATSEVGGLVFEFGDCIILDVVSFREDVDGRHASVVVIFNTENLRCCVTTIHRACSPPQIVCLPQPLLHQPCRVDVKLKMAHTGLSP